MFGYSMVQTVRTHAGKLDRPLREQVLNLYRPFKWTPCFLHNMFEGFIKKTRKLSVIIEFEEGCHHDGVEQTKKIASQHMRCKVRKEFAFISCCSADVTPAALEQLLNGCKHIKKIHHNREVRALLNVAVKSANAKNVVRDGGVPLTGEGVTIAVIDTGIHPHDDLSGRIIGFADLINNRANPYDDNGHGTHCAGDAAGNGLRSGGLYAGPAPAANLIGVKVLDKMGSGSLETVIAGVEWCINYNNTEPANPIDIISMSLGGPATDGDDPLVTAVETAWASGIVVCVAAGNEGPNPETIASPGISDLVITVGALDDRDTDSTRNDDEVAGFSSRGPAKDKVKLEDGTEVLMTIPKPDILAPGVNIVSLRSPNSYLDKLQKTARVGTDYFTLSGTSMATPICAGIVALYLQHVPGASPQQVKEALMNGTDLWKYAPDDPNRNIYGAGYIDADNSIPQ